ncbi:MAG: nucleotide sugar dehydrogenase [Anaerolineaceae bacterium]|nr:nucleotide sugar dehydrogenase [Anaerolineaceae bacterium]
MKFEKICVIGLGYIGLPTASTFATNGVRVVGVDINKSIIDTINRGDIHIYEPGLHEVVTEALESKMLSVSLIVEPSDAFIIAVPTPFYGDKKADLRAVRSAAETIVPFLRKGNLVILESTSPPKTTSNVVAPILEKSGLKAGEDFLLCYSPERVLPGRIMIELVENARVMGGITPESALAGKELYSAFVKGDVILTNATTAEMVKLMENTYRDVNIAVANEFARLADRFQIDVWEAIQIANLHPRVQILNPGPGVGGHCISVDPWFLVEAAPDLTPLIRTAREVNDSQPNYVKTLISRALDGDLKGKKIAVLGMAYKANVDDLRESPSRDVVHLLQDAGANVMAFEPYKPDAVIQGVNIVHSLHEAVEGADAIVVLLAHDQFKRLTPANLSAISSCKTIVDCARVMTGSDWSDAGYRVFQLGVG